MGKKSGKSRRPKQRAALTGGAEPAAPSSITPMVEAFLAQVAGGPPGGPGGDLAGLYSPGWPYGATPDALVEKIGIAERCEQLVCQQMAAMPVRVNPHDARHRVWLENPDPGHLNDFSESVFQMTWSYYRRGEVFLWATSHYADDYPASFMVLDPIGMDVEEVDGELEFWSNGVELNRDDVLWIKRKPTPRHVRGTGVLESRWSTMASAWASERHAATVLDGSGIPGAVLRHPGRLEAKKAKELQADWVAAVRSRMGAPAVLSGGLEFDTIGWSPKDLMLLELRQFDATQIASAYGVPPFLVNLPTGDSMTYQNPVNTFRLWWVSELMTGPASRLAKGLSQWLPSGTSVDFDPTELLRPDFAAHVTAIVALVQSGILSEDEAREILFDLPPMDETPVGILDAGDKSGSALRRPRIPIAPVIPIEVTRI